MRKNAKNPSAKGDGFFGEVEGVKFFEKFFSSTFIDSLWSFFGASGTGGVFNDFNRLKIKVFKVTE